MKRLVTLLVIALIIIGMNEGYKYNIKNKNDLAQDQLIEQLPEVKKIYRDNQELFQKIALNIQTLGKMVDPTISVRDGKVTWYQEESEVERRSDDLINQIEEDCRELYKKTGVEYITENGYPYDGNHFSCIDFTVWSGGEPLFISWNLLYIEEKVSEFDLMISMGENWYLNGSIHWPV